MIRPLFCAIVAAALCLAPALAQTAPKTREAIRLSFAPIVKQAAPAVVNVFSRRVVRTNASPFADDPFFRRFFGDRSPFGLPQERVQNSLGSGVIVDPDGLIVTNHHVIQEAQEITVVLSDRREFEARVLRSDERTDLAVLKVDPKGERLPTLPIGDSDALQVGDLVLAIGNPFGVGQTVTSGIVSGLARTAIGVSDFRSFIQTDAAINPGNSGGALVDVDGKLVGINTAIYSRSGGSVGLGFAIPTSMVRAVVEGAKSGKPITRAWLGASGQPVTAEIAQAAGLDRPRGVLVKEVSADSPAAQAGVRAGDVIVAISGHEVDDPEDLRFRVATLPAGAPVPLTLWRAGKQQETSATLVTPPETPSRDTQTLEGRHPLAGVTVSNLNPAIAEEMSLDMTTRGVVISDVRDRSAAQRIGLQKGDLLVSLNNKPLPTVAALRQVVNAASSPWTLSVKRGNQTLSVTVRD
ncbi:MAG TPA: DegQ family serine endoprotease [Stellaceae bacterium]|jgi:Do/DeqQ family serine protease|nr:DegQ family serine endoprotease [Stellaceae bacterium]